VAGLFYVPALNESDRQGSLPEDEAHHAVAVRRIRVGEKIDVTNGKGLVGHGEVIAIGTKPSSLEYTLHDVSLVPRKRSIHLAAAMPKGDRQRVLLEMATQVGLDEFTPLNCERSVGREGAKSSERWQRYCLEAMKQSRRAWLPVVQPEASLNDLLKSVSGNAMLICAVAGGVDIETLVPPDKDQGIILVVGPEGGLTDAERNAIRLSGGIEVGLGENVLRTETAAVVATALIRLLKV